MAVDPRVASALAELGLPPEADVRAVRQAYARRLKQIDQVTQAPAFQALRETYEAALAAVPRRDAEGADDAAPAEQATHGPDATKDSATLAELAFCALSDSLRAGLSNPAAAVNELRAALQPLDLAGGALFERAVARLLVEGWRPGHEFLFDAACEVFGWEADNSLLRKLGQAGDVLGAAIREKLTFDDQPTEVLARQRLLVRRLRNPNPPTPTLRRDERPLLRILMQRYPHWLGIVTSMDNAAKWLGGPDAQHAAYATPKTPPSAHVFDNPIVESLRIVAVLLWLIFMAWDYLR